MKTHSPLLILLLWLIGIIISSIILHSCRKCELENDYTIHFSNDSSTVRFTGALWQGYTQFDVNDRVISNMRGSFKEKNRVKVVPGAADFLMIIDSIKTESAEWTEDVLDPCYGEHNWIYQTLHPQETFTYTLHSSVITVYARLIDTLRGTTTPWNAHMYGGEYLTQPVDTTQCRQYEITGEGYPGYVLQEIGQQTGNSVCWWVGEAIEGH